MVNLGRGTDTDYRVKHSVQYSIFRITSGSYEVTLEDITFLLKKGYLVFVSMGMPVKFHCIEENSSYQLFKFDKRDIEEENIDYTKFPYFFTMDTTQFNAVLLQYMFDNFTEIENFEKKYLVNHLLFTIFYNSIDQIPDPIYIKRPHQRKFEYVTNKIQLENEIMEKKEEYGPSKYFLSQIRRAQKKNWF